jgi:hypothetical protein
MLAQLPLIIGSAAYFAANLFLWSLPISHESLAAIAAPLGILYFAAFMWYVLRTS